MKTIDYQEVVARMREYLTHEMLEAISPPEHEANEKALKRLELLVEIHTTRNKNE